MNKYVYSEYLDILSSELLVAFGCTEPIIIAYASAVATKVLGEEPHKLELQCSGNIIKNVKSVIVPNSGGKKGIKIAAALGAIGGDPDLQLEVLSAVTEEDIIAASAFVAGGGCSYRYVANVPKLYVGVTAIGDNHTSHVVLQRTHTQITDIILDGKVVTHSEPVDGEVGSGNLELLSMRDIFEFAECVEIKDIKPIIDKQIDYNTTISDEGLKKCYGAGIGPLLLKTYGNDVAIRARARAAAGSDARMSGCELPVVINSGSGNQGMCVSLPVIEYAKEWGASKEKLYRALVLSNLTSIHIKRFIGPLSAFCGAVSASCGAGAAITYLKDGTFDQICMTITNTLGDVSGIICDGAKSSCAYKISSSIESAILAHHMAMQNISLQPNDGIIKEDVESTIRSIGKMAYEGMATTDDVIMNIMTNQS